MEIKFLSGSRVYYQDTFEYQFEIAGQVHEFRLFDTPDTRQFWFDEVVYDFEEDEVLEGITIADLLNLI